MQALVFAIGNPLRGDDGVARTVCQTLGTEVCVVEEIQLTPEVAARMGPADVVIFVDADIEAESPRMEPVVEEAPTESSFSHVVSPASLVLIARKLYGFTGGAWVCRVPARDFTLGAELTAEASSGARGATRLIKELLEAKCTSPR